MEAGPSSKGGMGPTQLSWADLAAWEHGTGIELQPWESRLLRLLSLEYIKEGNRAEAHDALPPWVEAEVTVEAKAAMSLRDSMRAQVRDMGAPTQVVRRRDR